MHETEHRRTSPAAVWSYQESIRSSFITKTYIHLFAAIGLFTIIEILIFSSGLAEGMSRSLMSLPGGWLTVLGGFMVVNWISSRLAHTAENIGAQYAALAAFVVAEAIIFVPLLYVANEYFEGVISSAAIVSFAGFTGLTLVAFITRRDFSFLRAILYWGGLCALIVIVCGALFGYSLGPMFSVAMIAFAGAAILYDTSNVMHHYPPDRYVAASLELFASVALLFWYVLRLFMSSSRD